MPFGGALTFCLGLTVERLFSWGDVGRRRLSPNFAPRSVLVAAHFARSLRVKSARERRKTQRKRPGSGWRSGSSRGLPRRRLRIGVFSLFLFLSLFLRVPLSLRVAL